MHYINWTSNAYNYNPFFFFKTQSCVGKKDRQINCSHRLKAEQYSYKVLSATCLCYRRYPYNLFIIRIPLNSSKYYAVEVSPVWTYIFYRHIICIDIIINCLGTSLSQEITNINCSCIALFTTRKCKKKKK